MLDLLHRFPRKTICRIIESLNDPLLDRSTDQRSDLASNEAIGSWRNDSDYVFRFVKEQVKTSRDVSHE